MEQKELITFEYGAMSSLYSLQAENKLTAYVAMCIHFGRNSHLIALYEPKEIVKNDSWLNPMGTIAVRLDEIFGGQEMFNKYIEAHIEDIKQAYKTIKEL